MSQAQPRIALQPSRFQAALDSLPQVRMVKGEGIDYWRIGDVRKNEGEPPLVLADYGMDCLLGEALWQNFRTVIRRYPEEAETLVEMTLKHMVQAGALTGVEVAFLGLMAREMTKSFTASNVTPIRWEPVAARQAEPIT